MSADILDGLERFANGGYGDWSTVASKAIARIQLDAAEIVRLRGEVDALATELGERVALTYPDAPAMPNGVEDMHDDLSTPDLLNEAERIAVNQHKDGRYAAARILRILCHRLRAADNRDAAGVCDCPGIGKADKTLHAPNCPVRTAPAAAPAGEAVAWAVVGRGKVFSIERSYDVAHYLAVATPCEVRPLIYGDTTPQPADGEAGAPLGYVRRDAIRKLREDDEVTGVMVHVDAPSDSVPVYLHPPAPVQAAPQAYTSGHCAEKRKPGGCQLHNLHCNYPACDRKQVQAAPQEGEKAAATLRDALKYVGYRQDGDLSTLAERAELWMRESKVLIAMQQELAAHPSACELGQRLSDYLCGLAENGMVTLDPFDSNSIDAIVAALQHRGDSRGGEG